MIDLHTHILSGLDDGAKTLEESIQMCWVGYRDGIRTIVATPHTLNGIYQNDRSTILSKVQELQSAICHLPSAIDIKVLPGAEKLLSNRLIHFIASDAHSINGRPPVLSEAVKAAKKIIGEEEAQKMVTEYPQAILDGRRPDVPEPIPI